MVEAQHRPTVAAGDVRVATEVVTAFVREMAAGRAARDAEAADRRFAADVAWGSPYGATVHGIDALLPIHERLQREGVAGPSRYEIDRVLPLGDDVIVTHVARYAVGPDGATLPSDGSAFSELMLYVLVRRDGEWWLAAGHNTPIRPGGAVGSVGQELL
jgi:uncharacterized protein (TIGR02246 family)